MKRIVQSKEKFLEFVAEILRCRYSKNSFSNLTEKKLRSFCRSKFPKLYPCVIDVRGIERDGGLAGDWFEIKIKVKTLSQMKKNRAKLDKWISELENEEKKNIEENV